MIILKPSSSPQIQFLPVSFRSTSLSSLDLQQYIYQMMLKGLLLSAILLLFLANSAYQPQLMLTATSDIINKQIAINYGDIISKKINEYEIKDISGQQKTTGVTIHYNLSKIKQHVGIIWKANILQVKDTHSFVINSKNVSFDLNGYLEVKIGITKKQKGNLTVKITGLEVDTTVRFAGNKCPHSVGFDIQVDDVYVNTNSISIKIEGKGFDNLVISELQKIIIPRVPGLIKNALNDKVNPLISQYTCNRIEYDLAVNNVLYILIVNTTQVPEFDDGLKILRFPVDITLQNLKTNETNDQLERDDLPLNQLFEGSSDVSVALSSNFLNTVLWLVEDSKILYQIVTNQMLGPNPPIALNTTNLSILMPNLKKQWPNKEVFLIISPSSRYEHLLIRSGRIVTVLSLSVQFAVNVTGKPLAADECLKSGDCVIACNLNMTLPVSLALKLGNKLAIGLLHQASFYDISIIDSKIDINLVTLKAIINEIIGSMIPDLNQQLADGFELPASILQKLAKFDVSDIMSKTFQDFLALGLKLDL